MRLVKVQRGEKSVPSSPGFQDVLKPAFALSRKLACWPETADIAGDLECQTSLGPGAPTLTLYRDLKREEVPRHCGRHL